METTGIPIQELVGKIDRGEICLPEMQRGYVWKAAKVRDLLDSLYRGYPSGTILTWKTDEEVVTRKAAISQNNRLNQEFELLLDGQQRLTSLSAVIRGEPIYLGGQKKPIEIMFNLNHPDDLTFITEDEEDEGETIDATAEEKKRKKQKRLESMTFEVKSKQLESMPNWVSVTDVFKTAGNREFLKKVGLNDLDDALYDKYESRLNNLRKIKDYPYGVQVLERSKSYEEVTDIFVRVNSLGTKLKSTDLALAQITAKWRGSLEIFEAFQDKCKNKNFDLELGVFIKNLIAFAAGQSKFKMVSRLPKETLETAWVDSSKGFEYAIDFLKDNIGINNPALLSSPSILISVAYFAHHQNYKISAEDEEKLRYWVLTANAKGRYSRGSSETMLDQDLREIFNGKENNEGLRGMRNLLRIQFERLDITEESLKNKSSGSSYFKTMFIAFSKDGAKDWHSRLEISLNPAGAQHKLQFHHIFPESLLKKQTNDKQKINDICNLAFIGGKTNREITNRPPSDYLPEIVEKQGIEILKAQQIPTNRSLWEMDKYDKFLEERRKLVIERFKEFIKHDGAE